MAGDGSKLLTKKEVADYLRLHPETVRLLTRSKKLPAVKVGEHTIRYRAADIEAFLVSTTSKVPA